MRLHSFAAFCVFEDAFYGATLKYAHRHTHTHVKLVRV